MSPHAKSYSMVFIAGLTLAASSFVVTYRSHSPAMVANDRVVAPVADRPSRARYLIKVANIHLRQGMTRSEVAEAFELHGIQQVGAGRLGSSSTAFYGKGSLFDPVIAITFRSTGEHGRRVKDWYVEQ